MSRERANYPERPLRKGRPKSSTSGGRKSKVWTSACTEIKGVSMCRPA